MVAIGSSPEHIRSVIQGNLHDYMMLVRNLPGAVVADDPDALSVMTGLPVSTFNGVLPSGFEVDGEHLDARIDEMMRPFREKRVPMRWWVGTHVQPPDLGNHLEGHGLTCEVATPAMAVELSILGETLLPEGMVIERVVDEAALREWSDTIAFGLEAPAIVGDIWFKVWTGVGLGDNVPVRHFLVRLDGVPVSTSTIYLGQHAAGLYNVVTTPGARGKGAASAATVAALLCGRDAGYGLGVLESSEMGLGVYNRLGFKTYSEYSICLYMP